MRIERLECAWIKMRLPKPRGLSIGPITHSSDAVCRITTSGGLVGIGESRGSPLNEICEIIDTVFKPMLLGQHAAETEHHWQEMHRMLLGPEAGEPKWKRRSVLGAIAAVDMALWDIKAKAAKLSICRLLGGQPRPVQAYLSEGFYSDDQPLEEVAQEAAAGVGAGGFKKLKVRVGRDPEDDVKRLRAFREAVGEGVDIMVDINQMWDLPQAQATMPRLEEFNLFWLEEPNRLNRPADDFSAPERVTAKIMAMASIPLASGENHTTLDECRSLAENTPVRYMQFDAIKNGGVTEYLRVAAICQARGVLLAPHHVAHFHVQLAAAMPNGFTVEVFDNAKQHIAWPDLFPGYPEVREGKMILPDGPGWGMGINDDLINRHGVKVCWNA
jgi:L-alanine-DL-glutamate epimerase-like enolase superfamily enzyme